MELGTIEFLTLKISVVIVAGSFDTPGYLKGFDFVEEHMRAALFCRRCSLSECVEPRPPPICEFKGDVYVHEPYS